MTALPLILEPEQLEAELDNPDLLIVDLSRQSQYQQVHIPGAIWLDYGSITAMHKPVMGLLPDEQHLSRVLTALGLSPNKHLVAYDEEGGGKAARLIWTLDALGYTRTSLLNGGIISWYKEEHPLTADIVEPEPEVFVAEVSHPKVIADADYILPRLEDGSIQLLDARSAAEYDGSKRYAEKGGHIPGAIRYEWSDAMDQQRNLRLLPDEQIRAHLDSLGFTPDREIITYCQTHHRSALSYVMLKHLGYKHVRGYHGSWSEWGNRGDTPVEV